MAAVSFYLWNLIEYSGIVRFLSVCSLAAHTQKSGFFNFQGLIQNL